MTRTADEPRQEVVSTARIVAVREETPTVRELTLQIDDADFTFRPGNWVDFFIEEINKVGGYSMCSVPAELPSLRLAVKRSAHPPAAWCHSQAAAPGASVQVKAGGSFHWDPELDGPGTEHLLLVAGGIGINPLYSILQAASATPPGVLPELRCITLLYSASRPSELAYRSHLEQLAEADPRIRLRLHVTRNAAPEEPWDGDCVGRIDEAALAAALETAGGDRSKVLTYLCGPPAMTDELVSLMRTELGLPRSRVRFEKWW